MHRCRPRSGCGRPDPVPVGDRRRGAGGERAGPDAGRSSSPARCWPTSSSARSRWNDDAIVALNPDLGLPAIPIRVIHRSDGSGTTFNFVNYLGKVSPEWKQKVGEGTSVKWPAGRRQGQRRRCRVRQADQGWHRLRRTVLRAAEQAGLCALKNAAGNFVRPATKVSGCRHQRRLGQRRRFLSGDDRCPGAQAWPITATNFILMHKQPKNARKSKRARNSSSGSMPTAMRRPRP
jgi:phosphate transport system substrate-binding protein